MIPALIAAVWVTLPSAASAAQEPALASPQDVLAAARAGASRMAPLAASQPEDPAPVPDPLGLPPGGEARDVTLLELPFQKSPPNGPVVIVKLKAKRASRDSRPGVLHLREPFVEVSGGWLGETYKLASAGGLDDYLCQRLTGRAFPWRILGDTDPNRKMAHIRDGQMIVAAPSYNGLYIQALSCSDEPY